MGQGMWPFPLSLTAQISQVHGSRGQKGQDQAKGKGQGTRVGRTECHGPRQRGASRSESNYFWHGRCPPPPPPTTKSFTVGKNEFYSRPSWAVFRTGGGEIGTGEIGYGEMWLNKIVPDFAMVFKDRSQGMQGAEPLEQPLE